MQGSSALCVLIMFESLSGFPIPLSAGTLGIDCKELVVKTLILVFSRSGLADEPLVKHLGRH